LLKGMVETLKSEKYTILLTEQNTLFALDLSDRACVIDKGSIVYDGGVQDLRQNEEFMRRYLGV
jgi:branched-chain amino acid transport system ATP-binding protein